MFLANLLFALLIGVALTVLLIGGLRRTRDWNALLIVFLVIFLGSWAAATWIATGPLLYDVYWLPALVTGFLIAMLFLALVPPYSNAPRRLNRIEAAKEEIAQEQAATALSFFFWVLLLGLVFVIILGYVV